MRFGKILTVFFILLVFPQLVSGQPPVLTICDYSTVSSVSGGAAYFGMSVSPDSTYEANAIETYNYGLFGVATANGTGAKYGVQGWGLGDNGWKYGVQGRASGSPGNNYGVYGSADDTTDECYGVFGESFSDHGHGGHFVNADNASLTSQVGLWAGTYYGNIIEGHEVNVVGASVKLRFRVKWDGNVSADGTFTGGGADFAEFVIPKGGKNIFEPGDVLVISPDAEGMTNTVTKADEPYSTKVAGVYSTKPGFIGNRQGINNAGTGPEIPMAVLGFVPCKVSAENGSIKRGDLLVSSSTAGYAMRGTDRLKMIGSIVGKALDNLESGQGVIDILVTLQ